jgi:AcrR family transcriptional regulator
MPRSEASQNTRERILEATATMLHERGFLGLSLEEIAASVGIRKASLYHHFPKGKEQICLELVEQLLNRDEHDLQRALENAATGEARLEAMAGWIFSSPLSTESMLRDAMRFMSAAHQATIGAGFMRQLFAHVHEIFLKAVESEEFVVEDPELAAWAFLGMVTELSDKPGGAQGLERQVVRLFMNGLRAR